MDDKYVFLIMERNRFTLTYKEIDGVTAIWFELDGRYWIVDPCALLMAC